MVAAISEANVKPALKAASAASEPVSETAMVFAFSPPVLTTPITEKAGLSVASDFKTISPLPKPLEAVKREPAAELLIAPNKPSRIAARSASLPVTLYVAETL